MSGQQNNSNASNFTKVGQRGRNSTPQTAEQKMQKKLEASQKANNILSSTHIANLEVRADEKQFGKDPDLLVVKMGVPGGKTAQFVICRPIGFTPHLSTVDWVAIETSQIHTYMQNEKNPFEMKVGMTVANLKNASAIEAKVLVKNEDGELCYPGGKIRQKSLDYAKEMFTFHSKVEGAKKMVPSLLYMDPAERDAELILQKHWGTTSKLLVSIEEATLDYREWTTMGGVGNIAQVGIPYLKGVPKHLIQVFTQNRMLGIENPSGWSALLETESIKTDRFSPVYYEGVVDIKTDDMQKLQESIREFAVAYKAHNKLILVSKDDKAKDTPEQKTARANAHNTMQAKAHLVKEAELHGYTGVTQQAVHVQKNADGSSIVVKGKNQAKKKK